MLFGEKRERRFEKVLDTINSKYGYYIAICIVFIIIFVLNFFTPLITDDYSFSFIFEGTEKIKSFSDFITSNLNFFYGWSGRTITLSILQFFLLFNKNYFNIANTLVYILLIYLMYKHITNKKYNTILFATLNLALWFITPVWGQNILWLTGASTYLWSTVFILLFLLPFRYSFDNANYTLNKILSISMFFLGILAGWSMENSAVAVLFILIAYIIFKKLKKEKFKLFAVLGIIGFTIGFGFLILAPGNYARADVFETGPLVYELFKRFFSITTTSIRNLFILFIPIIFFLIEIIQQKKLKNGLPAYIYLLGGFASLYSMIVSPTFPDRAFFICVIFFTISICNLAQYIIFDKQIIRFYMTIFVMVTFLLFPISLYRASRHIVGTYIKWNNRIDYIYEQKEMGNYKIEVDPILAYDKHAAHYQLIDLNSDANDWPNPDIAKYFGIEEIKIEK